MLLCGAARRSPEKDHRRHGRVCDQLCTGCLKNKRRASRIDILVSSPNVIPCMQAVPLFLSEIAPPMMRGFLNQLFQLATTIGVSGSASCYACPVMCLSVTM